MANNPNDRKPDDSFDTPLNEDKEQFCDMKAEKPRKYDRKKNDTIITLGILVGIVVLVFIANSPAAICVLFLAIGVFIIVQPILKRHNLLKVCTEVVSATCIYLDAQESHDPDGDSVTLYAPTWEFRSGEKVYHISETTYSNMDVPKVGQNYKLFVNPVNPNQIYRSKPFSMILHIVAGAIFTIASVVAGIAVFTSF